MDEILIKQVEGKREREIFLTFPWKIYANDPIWVPPLLPERRKQVDPDRGVFFKRGYTEFFIAWQNNQPVGTICLAEDTVGNELVDKRDCLFGFFECTNDYSVAEHLFNFACDWAKSHNLSALYGPFNLDYEDGYGILVEGRDRPPAILCGHTTPYYQGFIERYGFLPGRGRNLAFGYEIEPNRETLKELIKTSDRVAIKKRFTIRPADFSAWEDEIDRVHGLLNRCLAHLPGHIPWQREAIQSAFAPFKQIADPDMILFAEHMGKTIGFFPGIPDMNRVFIKVNGLRYPWNYLSLAWHLRQKNPNLSIKSVLVEPEYWGTGVAILLFAEMAKRAMDRGYTWIDLSLTSDDNPKTPMLAERLGAKIYKQYQVYRYLIPG